MAEQDETPISTDSMTAITVPAAELRSRLKAVIPIHIFSRGSVLRHTLEALLHSNLLCCGCYALLGDASTGSSASPSSSLWSCASSSR